MIPIQTLGVSLLLVILLAACQSSPPPLPIQKEPASVLLDHCKKLDGIKLNVGLVAFDPGLGENQLIDSPFAQLRSAEAIYLPRLLKKTMDASAHWGAIRLLPETDPTAELQISGTIIESTGVELRVRIHAIDSAGRIWLDKIYSDRADTNAYFLISDDSEEPFQYGFNRMANDLAQIKELLTEKQLEHLLQTSILRYGIALSAESFAGYLTLNRDKQVEVVGLPHRQDPMFNRVKSIRDQEYAFTDAVDRHYEILFKRMRETYTYWRSYSFELISGNQNLKGSAQASKNRIGRWKSMEKGYKTYREWRMNEDALREITDSFDREITPTVIAIEGRVLDLNGSLLTQYHAWRELLRAIYAEETGLPVAVEESR